MKEKKIATEYVKYVFSEAEKRELAVDMALKVSNLQSAEDEKKAIMSDLKSKIDGLQAAINGAATKLNNGYEMRTMDCEVVPCYERRVWQYFRVDNEELVRERKMSVEDLQMKIGEPA